MPSQDHYTPGDPSAREPIGLYHIVPDAGGAAVLRFDDPDRAAPPPDDSQTGQEVQHLQYEKAKLEMLLSSAAPEQAEEIRQRLEALETQLQQKGGNAYRLRAGDYLPNLGPPPLPPIQEELFGDPES